MMSATDLLQRYLAQLRDRDVTHVRLNDPARDRLRRGLPTLPAEPVVPSATVAAPPPTPKSTQDQDKASRLAAVAAEAAASPACRALGTLREEMVFATGNPDAALMLIGEAPGAEEERRGEPFVGPAGQLLTRILQAMGFQRGDVYISNICKFRPVVTDGRPQGNRNRTPTRQEMNTCLSFVTREIAIVQPQIIVALGATACNGLGIEGSVGRLRGQFHEFQGIPVMATYHPSFLLRREEEGGSGIKEKRLVWQDMLKVMERLGMAISPKQRAYFSNAGGD